MIYDTIILAGDKSYSRSILSENKCLLPIKGIPLFVYILKTLAKVKYVNKVFIIGPKEKILNIINKHFLHKEEMITIKVLDQKQTVYENFWYAYNNTFENFEKNSQYYMVSPEYQEKTVLVMPGDIPLLTSREVEYFLCNCNTKKFDYFVGLTSNKKLKKFYPTNNEPGIKMAYVHLKEGLFRSYNLHLIKPGKIGNAKYIQKFYKFRYQKELKNILQLSSELVKTKENYIALWYYVLMQFALFFSSIHLKNISYIIRQYIPIYKVEKCISNLLETRFKSIFIPFQGATLDIDNEKSYKAMNIMFDKWKIYLENEQIK